MPLRAAALQAAWRPTARPKAVAGVCRSSTGGIRTHTHQGLSLVAAASWRTVPHIHHQSPRWESNPHVRHTKTASCHYITRAYKLSQFVINKSAQWESNPHVRHGKAVGYRYIMGAFVYQPITNSTSGGDCTRESTLEEWRVAATPRTPVSFTFHSSSSVCRLQLGTWNSGTWNFSPVEAVGIEPT